MRKIRVTLAQINPTIGDITGNIALMCAAAAQAAAEQSDLVIFPELSLTGYTPGDMLDEPDFLQRVHDGIISLMHASKEHPALNWVIGAPTHRTGPGKSLQNSLLVLRDGSYALSYGKQLLPTYNVFDERRYFEPGPDTAKVLRVGDAQVGFLICEDGWNDDGLEYAVNPFTRLADASPDLVVSINASPSSLGKRDLRHALFTKASRRYDFPIVYVNQVGGHDQLVFDGASFVVTPDRGVVYESARFAPEVTTLEMSNGYFTRDGQPLEPVGRDSMPPMEFYRQQIVLGLRDYARRCGFTKAVIGSSGGIDSALTMALAVEALGAENVVGITMPSRFSSDGSVSDSEQLCLNLGMKLIEHPIRDIVSSFEHGFGVAIGEPVKGLALENLQARVRGTLLMEYSNSYGHLLLTTGNKSEISVGYCTLYGDTNGGLGLIGDLYKTEVFELCRHINATAGIEIIPFSIIDKEPSAELAPGQKDTDSLPPYPVLDAILKLLIEGSRLSEEEGAVARATFDDLVSTPEGRALVNRIKRMIARNEYKRRQAPPIIRVRGRAFGSGRQMPIAAKYE